MILGYCRVSTRQQAGPEKGSLEEQENKIRAYAMAAGVDRFGLAVGQPVEAGDTDENAETFTDRQIVGEGHQRTWRAIAGMAAKAGWAGISPNRCWRAASMNCLMFISIMLQVSSCWDCCLSMHCILWAAMPRVCCASVAST